MHEASIAYNLIHNILEIARDNRLTKVTRVQLSIGRMHHIVPEVLRRHFRLMGKKYPVLARARLKVESQNIRIRCKKCGTETELTETIFLCPHCQGMEIEMTAGTDMHIVDLRGIRDDS